MRQTASPAAFPPAAEAVVAGDHPGRPLGLPLGLLSRPQRRPPRLRLRRALLLLSRLRRCWWRRWRCGRTSQGRTLRRARNLPRPGIPRHPPTPRMTQPQRRPHVTTLPSLQRLLHTAPHCYYATVTTPHPSICVLTCVHIEQLGLPQRWSGTLCVLRTPKRTWLEGRDTILDYTVALDEAASSSLSYGLFAWSTFPILSAHRLHLPARNSAHHHRTQCTTASSIRKAACLHIYSKASLYRSSLRCTNRASLYRRFLLCNR